MSKGFIHIIMLLRGDRVLEHRGVVAFESCVHSLVERHSLNPAFWNYSKPPRIKGRA
ncbi:MAG: hypothetical protein NT178_16325 [Proteobacteria bacterium]|nr:hypothetical protein [Pseudomonadota bacterium]